MLIDWFNKEAKQPTWLIDDFLPAGAIVIFSGPRKRGFKTFAQKFITSVAASGEIYMCPNEGKPKKGTGEPTKLSGEVFALKPCKASVVLSCQQEGTVSGNKERIGKIALGLGAIEPEELIKYQNSYGFDDWKLQLKQGRTIPPFLKNYHFEHRPDIKLDNPESLTRLTTKVNDLKPDIIVLDAITYMHKGKENDPETMLNVVNALFWLRATGATVIAICHTNKASQSNVELKDIDIDLRGSSVMLDAYDAHFGFRRWSPGQGHIDLICRYREREEQQFKVRWEIPEKGTVAPIKLNMVRVKDE